jgi:hypothetical protein
LSAVRHEQYRSVQSIGVFTIHQQPGRPRISIPRGTAPTLHGGTCAAVVEHESHETFMAMHSSPIHEEAEKRVRALLDGHPTPRFYEVIVG